jgi:hypothetical protein
VCPGVLGPRIEGVQDCQWWGGAAWAKYHPPRFKRCQISLPHMCRLHASSECHMHESWSNLSKLNLKQGQKSPWRALDLFSGTGSVATVLRGLGWEVTTWILTSKPKPPSKSTCSSGSTGNFRGATSSWWLPDPPVRIIQSLNSGAAGLQNGRQVDLQDP